MASTKEKTSKTPSRSTAAKPTAAKETVKETAVKEAPKASKPAPAAKNGQHQVSPQQIAERAYKLWQERGCLHGSDQTDWLRAEKELVETAS